MSVWRFYDLLKASNAFLILVVPVDICSVLLILETKESRFAIILQYSDAKPGDSVVTNYDCTTAVGANRRLTAPIKSIKAH